MGGYLAGRLRTKWAHIHTDEVYFRDTAHGFLVWAVGLVLSAAFLVSAATSMAGAPLAASTTNGAPGASLLNPDAYYVDMLLRSGSAVGGRNDVYERGEVERIFAHALHSGSMAVADDAYLAQIVSARSGLAGSDAEKRVSDIFLSAQQSADSARKALGRPWRICRYGCSSPC